LLGKPVAHTVALTRGYRVPAEILDFANRLLPSLGVDVAPAESLRRTPGSLRVRRTPAVATTAAAVVEELVQAAGSIGVIGLDGELDRVRAALRGHGVDLDDVAHGMEHRVTLVPVTVCKGLEFDHVVVVEPATIAALARGRNWLYVALTRAVTTLTVVHADDLPVELHERPAA
jgi:DNA helicase IV